MSQGWVVSLVVLFLIACMPGNACPQDNLIAGEKINGYTDVPFDTTAYPYDYLVDGSIPQDDPANKRFRTVQAAYEAAPSGSPEKPTVIGINPDVYFLRGTETTAGLTIRKNYITLLGLTDDRRKVVLADNRGHMQGAIDNGYVLTVDAIGFTAANLTILNYCNLDYEYPGNPAKDLKMRSPFDSQAVAIQMRGDKQTYSHVAFLGRHDTMFIQALRTYFTNVYLEGTEDFMGSVGTGSVSVWENSEIYFPTGSGVMVASGVTFINTVFKASHGLAFNRGTSIPPVLINCLVPVNTPQSPVMWLSGKPPAGQIAYSLTYHTKDARGNPAVIFDSNVGPPTFKLSRELSDEEAAAFNPWNLLRATATGVADDWDPTGAKVRYASQGNSVYRMRFVGSTPQAGAGFVSAGPFRPEVTELPSVRTGGPGTNLRVSVSPARVQGDSITWSTSSNSLSIDKTIGESVILSARNETDHVEYANVDAKASNGFYITTRVKVEPVFVPAPRFTQTPRLLAPSGGRITVDYTLDDGGQEDRSTVTWYLCDDTQCSSRRKVAVSRGDEPLKEYVLTSGAIGKYVEAEVQAKDDRSDPGRALVAISTTPVVAKDIEVTTISPNFRNFVDTTNDTYANGMWTLLGTWQSVTNDNLVYSRSPIGDDLVNGYGLRAASRGAWLLYQNDAPIGDMQLRVVMTPEKTTGEGFGSPGSSDDAEGVQRADVFIKYDPRTRTGYSLRFWHIIQSPHECMFQLYKIENGVGSPVSGEQELTGVFKPNTTITLSISGSTFTARGANSMDGATLSLQGTIIPNDFGGAGFYWGGTVYIGNSNVLSLFEISYPMQHR